jgi:hypothetical protein
METMTKRAGEHDMGMPFPKVRVGEPIRCAGMTLFPLFTEESTGGDLDYILAHEAISAGMVVVSEVSEAGSVSEVVVENNGRLPVLILEGTELRGARQNRMVNRTVLIGGKSHVRIPVACVERRRWRYQSRQFSSGSHCPPSMGSLLKRIASGKHGSHSDQIALWGEIRRRHETMGVSSPTDDLHAALETHRERIERVQEQLPYPQDASGVAIALGGRIVAIEIFDKPETLRKLWGRLVQGIAIDALEARGNGYETAGAEVSVRLYRTRGMRWQQVTPIGLGEMYQARGTDSTMATALIVHGTMLHLSVSVPCQESEPRRSKV